NTAVSLFAGLMPVPGGMGVSEAGYTAGLQAIGVDSAVAMSTAIAFRLVTFYLPPIWGAFAMRWLRKSAYV
ncbi:MAG: lysylphosphatidylglycerol synthase domain-containing protein, partial [Microbacterium pygmaeum]